MSLSRGAAITCAALAVAATPASAATLAVSVKPTTVHRNQTYAITITGHYRRRRPHHTPHLLAFIQYTGAACRSSATAEYRLPMTEWSWLFVPPQRAETSRRFKEVVYERARTRFGNRRVCAYLYATRITPQTTDQPLARAGAAFREIK